jgi:hypothetical protein
MCYSSQIFRITIWHSFGTAYIRQLINKFRNKLREANMKTLKYFLILFSFIGLMFYGCSDEPESPLSPSDQTLLQKVFTREFTGINIPTGVIDMGIYKYPDNKIILLKHKGPTLFTAYFADGGPDILSGPGEIEINGITDMTTMTGQWRGKLVLTPDEVPDGLWQFTWHGPAVFDLTAWEGGPGWLCSFQMMGHGEGDDVTGMQCRMELRVYCAPDLSTWKVEVIRGVLTSH